MPSAVALGKRWPASRGKNKNFRPEPPIWTSGLSRRVHYPSTKRCGLPLPWRISSAQAGVPLLSSPRPLHSWPSRSSRESSFSPPIRGTRRSISFTSCEGRPTSSPLQKLGGECSWRLTGDEREGQRSGPLPADAMGQGHVESDRGSSAQDEEGFPARSASCGRGRVLLEEGSRGLIRHGTAYPV